MSAGLDAEQRSNIVVPWWKSKDEWNENNFRTKQIMQCKKLNIN